MKGFCSQVKCLRAGYYFTFAVLGKDHEYRRTTGVLSFNKGSDGVYAVWRRVSYFQGIR